MEEIIKMNWDEHCENYKKMINDLNFKVKGTKPKNKIKYFYYDESDNIRNFNLKKGGYNIDYFPQFTLGGIVSDTPINDLDLEELYDKLYLQKSIRELKSRNILKKKLNKKESEVAQFESKNLNILLTFLLESNYHLHYSAINLFYFGVVVDIIDSLLEFNKDIYCSQSSVNSLKACLYKCMYSEAKNWGKILSELKFPNLNLKSQEILFHELYSSISRFDDHKYTSQKEQILYLIKNFPKDRNLIFLSDEEDCILINNFKDFYLQKVFIYDKAKHIFDEEPEIKKLLEKEGIKEFNIYNRYEFVTSHDIKAIQISDVCVNVISILYKFLASKNLFEIENYIKELDQNLYEYKNLKLLIKLIYKTLNYDEYLIMHMSNDVELEKYNFILNAFNN